MADLKKKDEEMEEDAKDEMKDDEAIEEEEEAEKSADLTEDDLQKSLDQLETLVKSEDAPTRKAELADKALTQDLSKSEADELYALLGGDIGVEVEPTLVEDIEKSMSEVVDVSEYLDKQHDALTKSLGALSSHVEASDNRQNEFNMILAKATGQMGKTLQGLHKSINAINERMGMIESQPARGPKSQGATAQPMEKSFANSSQPEMPRVQILGTLMDMTKSFGGALEDGTDLTMAIAKYETTGAIAPALLERVKNHKADA